MQQSKHLCAMIPPTMKSFWFTSLSGTLVHQVASSNPQVVVKMRSPHSV